MPKINQPQGFSPFDPPPLTPKGDRNAESALTALDYPKHDFTYNSPITRYDLYDFQRAVESQATTAEGLEGELEQASKTVAELADKITELTDKVDELTKAVDKLIKATDSLVEQTVTSDA